MIRKSCFVQALPCTKAHIEANPNLKEDHTMGVLAGEFPVNYESFDDVVASGKILFNICNCSSVPALAATGKINRVRSQHSAFNLNN